MVAEMHCLEAYNRRLLAFPQLKESETTPEYVG
jgi:hypothetical protein